MITLDLVYWLAGAYLLAVAALGLRDRHNPRRHTTALFWGLLGAMLLAADRRRALVGAVVVLLACLLGFGGLARGRYEETSTADREAEARRLATACSGPPCSSPRSACCSRWCSRTCASANASCSGAAHHPGRARHRPRGGGDRRRRLTRQSPWSAVEQSRRLIDAVGWAALLLLLATLGSVFAAAGVGDAVAGLVRMAIPVDNRFVVVAAYAIGMALFTIIMGNAFAAFPVLTAGIGLPLLVQRHGADPASLAAIGMLSGYCGTLLTPMAANFNLVPAALLELTDPNAVIRQQVATALPLLACNIALMYFIVFR